MISRLRRITSSTNFLAEIDALRFVAIMPVFLQHIGTFLLTDTATAYSDDALASDPLHYLRIFTPIGVPLFYCISGFILSLPFSNPLKPKLGYGKYLTRRLSRLEPPFILCMCAFFLGHVLVFGAPVSEYLLRLLASLTYTHNLFYGTWSAINPVAWTLEIEVQFYLLAPLLVSSLAKLTSATRNSAIIAGIVLFTLVEYFASDYLALYHLDRSILTKAHYFLIGILICFYHQKNPLRKTDKSYAWDLVALLAIPLSQLDKFLPVDKLADQFAFNLSILLVFFAAFKGRFANRIANFPLIYVWGGMCYSIYLLHYPIIHLFGKYAAAFHQTGTYWSDFLFQVVTTGTATMAICIAFYILIERPCMDPNWPSKVLEKLRSPSQ